MVGHGYNRVPLRQAGVAGYQFPIRHHNGVVTIMGILIGLSVAAGAIFLGWLFLKLKARGAASAASGGPGGIFGGLENYATTGLALASHGLSYGQTTSTAIG